MGQEYLATMEPQTLDVRKIYKIKNTGFTLIRTRDRNLVKGFTLLKTSPSENFVSIKRGFTLIELLVVLTIIAILFGVGFANYRGFSRAKDLERVKREVVADLRVAQENALSGKKPLNEPECNDPGNSLSAHSFTIGAIFTKYELSYVCTDGLSDVDIIYKTVEDIFGNDYSIVPTSGPSSVNFLVLGQGTDLPVDVEMEIEITQLATEDKVSIMVTPGGEIK